MVFPCSFVVIFLLAKFHIEFCSWKSIPHMENHEQWCVMQVIFIVLWICFFLKILLQFNVESFQFDVGMRNQMQMQSFCLLIFRNYNMCGPCIINQLDGQKEISSNILLGICVHYSFISKTTCTTNFIIIVGLALLWSK